MTHDTVRIGPSYGRRGRFAGPVLTMTARRKHRTRPPVHRDLPADETSKRSSSPPTTRPSRSPASPARAGAGAARGFVARFLGSIVGRVLYEWVQDLLGLGS